MGYYVDEEKITFDEADRLVDRYLRRGSPMRKTVSASQIIDRYDIDDSRHNIIRVSEALDSRLEVELERRRGEVLYSLPDSE